MKRIKFTLAISLLMGFTGCFACALWPYSFVSGQGSVPAAPTGVEASDNAYNNKVGIRWDAMRGATSYQVFRNTTNDAATATSIGTTAEAVFFDTTATAGQQFFYWVRAVNANGASGFSVADSGARGTGTTTGLNPPNAPAGNPTTAAKAALGKALFWDEQLSSSRTVACGTCHIARGGGSDPRSTSANTAARHPGADGIFGTADDVQGSPGVPLAQADGSYTGSAAFGLREQVTKRRSMPQVNSGYPGLLFWEGRASNTFRDPLTSAVVLASGGALESQSLEPPVSDVEMGHTARNWNDIAARVAAVKPLALSPSVPAALTAWIGERSYPELFNEAFGAPEVTPARIAMALATYQRTLYSDRAPIDVGDLTAQEARGQQVYNANDCNDCHAAPLFGSDQLQNTGVRPSSEDTGRFAVTNNQNDLGRFRSVSLRNVELRAPYMHNGLFNTLEEVVEFYNRGGDFPGPNTNRNEIRPRNLSAQQKADLVAFLKRPLTDPRMAAELPPFDRPLLYSESMRVPQLIGARVNGAPQVIALEPPLVGNPSFTIGVSSALGGATATLVIDRDEPGAQMPGGASFAFVSTTLKGAGAGNGYGSVSLTIPNNPALIGATLYGRWYVNDAVANGGVATSQSFKFTVFGSVTSDAPAVTSISAASYAAGQVTPESIVVGFGNNLATATVVANSLPLPDTLVGVTVMVRDVLGVERRAPLFFVSPNQVNYQIPAGTAIGEASLKVLQGSSLIGSGLLQIASVAPGLFTANANGLGVPAAVLLRIKPDGAQGYEPVAQFDQSQNRYVATPVDLGAAGDQVYLIPFGTGFRNRSALSAVSCSIGGTNAEVIFAGAQGQLVGVDQANILIPRSVAGRGNVDLIFSVDGKTANTVTLNIK